MVDREIPFRSLETLLRFAFQENRKTLNTSMPGIIEKYDYPTKRCFVKPAIQLLKAEPDNQNNPSESLLVSRATISNVPVLFPSFGGYTILFPVRVGDTVQILFNQRGLDQFKKTFEESPPSPERYLNIIDAVVIPGFGALSVTPATMQGVSMQDESGNDYIYIEPGNIKIKSTDTFMVESSGALSMVSQDDITLNAQGKIKLISQDDLEIETQANVEIDSSELNHKNKNIGSTHRHWIQRMPPQQTLEPV